MTEGIKYIGSKKKIVPHILRIVRALPDVRTILDGFAGTTRVGQALRSKGYTVYSNDLSDYSYVFSKCYLETTNYGILEKAQKIIDYLNSLEGKVGLLTRYYSGGSKSIKNGNQVKNEIMFWQVKNTMKADAIREYIDKYKSDEILFSILLTSLILALDKVDNTVGVQQAFLKKKWAPRSFNDLKLMLPAIPIYGPKGVTYRSDANLLVKDDIQFDVAYYDPPYTTHNYASYYHIWDTLVKNNVSEVSGIINRRKDILKSRYNRRQEALEAMSELILDTQSKYIIISYNNEGIILFEDLISVCKQKGVVDVIEIDYKRNIMSQIGIYNLNGLKVGDPGAKKNIEYLIKVSVQ